MLQVELYFVSNVAGSACADCGEVHQYLTTFIGTCVPTAFSEDRAKELGGNDIEATHDRPAVAERDPAPAVLGPAEPAVRVRRG